MRPAELRLRFAGRQSALNRLLDRFHAFAAARQLPAAAERDAHLVLDEIVSNVIRHGRVGRRAPEIEVRATITSDMLRIHIVDDGRAFDPLSSAPSAVIDGPPSERPIGGLGVYLTTQLMDHVEYRRTNGRNRMTLERSIARDDE
jgi:serine/threonine-protein kinase RsbW